MRPTNLTSPLKTVLFWAWLLATVAALAPWWHNRLFVRDFFDYGLMVIASGRLNSGESPYIDFATPLQSCSYWVNTWVEQAFGSTFQALTWGNALFIVLSVTLLVKLLGPRKTPITASILALGVVVGSASQHTIIWYNAIGAFTVAGVAWGSAKNPTWSRDTMWSTLLIALLLIISGTNKINFHAVALAVACCWTLRAGIIGRASWACVAGTIAIWLSAGLLLPVLIELQLSGAPFGLWLTNVIEMPFSSRGNNLSEMLTTGFYLHPMHDYYGPVLQPVGAILVGWVALTISLAWKDREGMDRGLLIAAGIVGLVGCGGLLATNHEIVYVTLSAGIGIIVSLWLGFGLWDRERLRHWCLTAPVAALAIIMFTSAWQGQRSQFGHSDAPREAYQTFFDDDETFGYFAGTFLPPRLFDSLLQLKAIMPEANEAGHHPVFYATGAEFLERIWPNAHLAGMPMLLDSLTLGPEQDIAMKAAFLPPPTYEMLVGMQAWEGSWPGSLGSVVFRQSTERSELNLFTIYRFGGDWLKDGIPPTNDAIMVVNDYASNMDAQQVTIDEPLWSFEANDGRAFLGTHRGRGLFTFHKPSFRLEGEIVIERYDPTEQHTVSATFSVLDGEIKEGDVGSVIWSDRLEMGPGEAFKRLSYKVDSRGRPSRFLVSVPPESEGTIKAGFTLPQINHADPTPTPAPVLRPPALPANPEGERMAGILFPDEWAKQMQFEFRGGRISADGKVQILPGEEIWFKPNESFQEFVGKLTLTAGNVESGVPIARVVWYQGGRVQLLNQSGFHSPDGVLPIRGWPVNDGGWFGILIDPVDGDKPINVEIDRIQAR